MAVTPMPRTESTSGSHLAYLMLYLGYVILPIVAGVDKFLNALADWSTYLAPQIPAWTNLDAATCMRAVGAIEISAGLLLFIRPRIGGYIVGFWLWGIIANLMLGDGHYDIALRDFVLSLGAFALAHMARDERL